MFNSNQVETSNSDRGAYEKNKIEVRRLSKPFICFAWASLFADNLICLSVKKSAKTTLFAL